MQATRTVCNQCNGVIPQGAPHATITDAVLHLATGDQPFTNLDFCCTAHLFAYVQAQPPIPAPASPYPVIP